MNHTHPILVFEDEMELHRKKERDRDQCRPIHESVYDAKGYVVRELVDEGFEPCSECMTDARERYFEEAE